MTSRRTGFLQRWLAPVLCAGLIATAGPVAGCTASEAPDSVLLIVVDTLRADHLGAYGYDRDTSPHLDARAEGGLVFERAFSTSSWTLPAFGSMYTGRYPRGHGAGSLRVASEGASGRQRFAGLDGALPTMAEILADAGLATGAVLGNPFLSEGFGTARGFDDYDLHPGREAAATVDRALAWLDAHPDAPSFLMVHFMDPHLPYDPPAEMRGRFTGESGRAGIEYPVRQVHALRRRLPELDHRDRAFITAAYDEEIAGLDVQLGRLFAGLDERSRWRRSLVVLTSDHGEELFEHGGFEHGHALFDEVVRVPLILWAPGLEPGVSERPVSLVDLLPTVLDVLAIDHGPPPPAPSGVLDGISLLAAAPREGAAPGRGLVAEGLLGAADASSVILWPHKVIFEQDRRLLFDLAADPGERTDLAGEAELAPITALARELLRAPGATPAEAVLDEELRRQLRAIGYLQ